VSMIVDVGAKFQRFLSFYNNVWCHLLKTVILISRSKGRLLLSTVHSGRLRRESGKFSLKRKRSPVRVPL